MLSLTSPHIGAVKVARSSKDIVSLFGVLALFALTGCATSDAKIYPGFFGQNVTGNEAYVSISNVWNEGDALPLADQHCSKYDKIARFSAMNGNRAIFDCVSK